MERSAPHDLGGILRLIQAGKISVSDKTSLPSAASIKAIAEYSSESKQNAPVTLSTYQMLTYRSQKDGDFPHFELFNAQVWGLIIYDEVNLLPAPVFRITAELQARRRLGLTATFGANFATKSRSPSRPFL